ncbi:MAG TPA: hypothetical protein VKC60_02340 [Opitutaceae bacterium]|nr:hypothetical protein [Opitutaceae bacterium]
MSDSATVTTSSSRSPLFTVLGAIGCFAIFLLIVFIAYLPKKPDQVEQGNLSPEERKTKLVELRANEKKVATSYAWIDQAKGVVQIPIDEAMRLTVQDLQTKK